MAKRGGKQAGGKGSRRASRQAAETDMPGGIDDYHVGQTVTGDVVSKRDYGLFVRLDPGTTGLLRISG